MSIENLGKLCYPVMSKTSNNSLQRAEKSVVLMRINCVFNEIRVYTVDGCITVELHKSDNRNVLLGPLLINT